MATVLLTVCGILSVMKSGAIPVIILNNVHILKTKTKTKQILEVSVSDPVSWYTFILIRFFLGFE